MLRAERPASSMISPSLVTIGVKADQRQWLRRSAWRNPPAPSRQSSSAGILMNRSLISYARRVLLSALSGVRRTSGAVAHCRAPSVLSELGQRDELSPGMRPNENLPAPHLLSSFVQS